MIDNFYIRRLESSDISTIRDWARNEGFCPGIEDILVYKNTDNKGIWVGCLNDLPIGCIAGIRYNSSYGFIGLFIVLKEFRGNGYGVKLWKHALKYLEKIPIIGLEAAINRLDDYKKWGFKLSSKTTRWKFDFSNNFLVDKLYPEINNDFAVVHSRNVPSEQIQIYDAKRESNSRPHFLSDWLNNKNGNLSVLVDKNSSCHGFGLIRPCLLRNGKGWRIGPILADTPPLAELLIRDLLLNHDGTVFLDSPGLNPYSKFLLEKLGFTEDSYTFRMYKGEYTNISLNQVYGLACLELG